MGEVAFQIISLTIVYSTVYSDADQWKYQSSASLAFVRGIHRSPVNSPHKRQVTRKLFPFDDAIMFCPTVLNTLRPVLAGCQFPDDIFKCIFLNESVWIYIKITLKFVPKRPINSIPALVQIMARRRSGDRPLSEPVIFSLLTHICITRPQWVNTTNRNTMAVVFCWVLLIISDIQ